MFYYIYHADFVNKSLLLQRFFILFTNFTCCFSCKRFHKWRKKKDYFFHFPK